MYALIQQLERVLRKIQKMLQRFVPCKRVRLDTTRQLVEQMYCYHDWNLAVIIKGQQTSDLLEMSIRQNGRFWKHDATRVEGTNGHWLVAEASRNAMRWSNAEGNLWVIIAKVLLWD